MNSTASPTKKFPSRSVSGGVVAMFLAFGVGRFAYTPLLPLMHEQAGLALDVAGYLASIMYLGYLAGSIIVTRTLSRYGAFTLLRTGLIMLMLGTWAMSTGNVFSFWAVIMFFIGVASAAIFLSTLSLVLGVFLEHGAGWLTAFLYAGIGLAIVLIGLAVPEIGTATGWRSAWNFVAITAATGAILCLWILAPCRRSRGQQLSTESAWIIKGAKRAAFFLIAAYCLHGFAYTIAGTFMVAMLGNLPGVQGHAHLGWVLVGVMVIPSCLVWPLVAARIGEVKTTAILLVLLAGSNIIVILWPSQLGVLVAAGVFGSSFLVIPGLVLGRLGRLAGSKKDEVAGFATVMFGIAMVFGPSVGGLVSRLTGSFDWALGMASVALLFAAAMTIMAELATKHRREPVQACLEGCR